MHVVLQKNDEGIVFWNIQLFLVQLQCAFCHKEKSVFLSYRPGSSLLDITRSRLPVHKSRQPTGLLSSA